MEETIQQLRDQALKEIDATVQLKEIESLKVKYLGRKGPIQNLMISLKEIAADLRPQIGKMINDLKAEIESSIHEKYQTLLYREQNARLEHEKIDVTLPGRRKFLGRRHVGLSTLDEILDILTEMGFTVQYGPDIESDYYNFEALNFAKDHPARDMQDTFYVASDFLLRTHTSNTQVRVMETHQPPIRVIMPGKCYRNEDVTARSHVVFHQVEGMYIDKDVSFSDLVGTLEEFFTKFFKKTISLRLRPSYFPFVEPGMEVDVSCISCNGRGCNVCKYSGWLEVAGAGMIHPEVLKNGGIDPEVYSGYAWGMGPDRMTMLRYGIQDIRLFMENNLKFLQQF